MYYYSFFVALLFSCRAYELGKGPKVVSTQPKDHSVCGKAVGNSNKMRGVHFSLLDRSPWKVALGYRRENDPTVLWKCEGNLISDRWVLTSGHCVDHTENFRLTTARMGDLNLDDKVDDGAFPVDIEVENIIPHPQFVPNPLTNDIALLRLKNPVIFSEHIRPICIFNASSYTNDSFYLHRSAFLAGWHWRYRDSGKKDSMLLEETNVSIEDRELCVRQYRQITKSPIDIRTLCVVRDIDTCENDLDGPILLVHRGSHYLAGVLSFDGECNSIHHNDYPRVYTKVAYYSDWIANFTGIKI